MKKRSRKQRKAFWPFRIRTRPLEAAGMPEPGLLKTPMKLTASSGISWFPWEPQIRIMWNGCTGFTIYRIIWCCAGNRLIQETLNQGNVSYQEKAGRFSALCRYGLLIVSGIMLGAILWLTKVLSDTMVEIRF